MTEKYGLAKRSDAGAGIPVYASHLATWAPQHDVWSKISLYDTHLELVALTWAHLFSQQFRHPPVGLDGETHRLEERVLIPSARNSGIDNEPRWG
jgi:hypothetical protein